MIINYAHRGASGYCPENTMASFQKAIELGCQGIETDVQITSDGNLVLIHDEKVDRTTNSVGYVKDFTFEELRKLDAGSWLDSTYSKEKIPSAEELILLAKEQNITINFELKNGIIMYPDLEKKILELIYKYDMQQKVILSSFNHYSMHTCKEISKEIKTGLLYMEGLYEPQLYCKQVNADAIHPNYNAINKEIVKNCKAAGVLVNPFTVNDESVMKHLIAAGVDGIITNYPDKLKKLLV